MSLHGGADLADLLMAKRILLVRLSAMGDIVFASPLVAAFRRRYPDAHLSWLVDQPFADLLVSDPMLDAVIVLPTRDWRRLARERHYLALAGAVRSFVRDLRAQRFDLVVDLQGLLKSGVWAWLSGGTRRIGLGSREGSRYLMHRVVDRHGGDRARVGSEYLFLAGQLGLPVDGFPMRVAVSAEAADRAKGLVAESVGDASYGVICPFTTRPQKHWLAERWIELVPRLEARFGGAVVMLGGPGDTAPARAIAGGCGVANLVGRTDIPTAAAVIEGARYVVGVDTGLTHMGLAFGKPTVCLFGSTRPYTDTATPAGRVLYHDLPCAPCRRRPTCDGAYSCMTGIGVGEVTALLDSLLPQETRPT
jgi:heptosyltransferase-1